MWVARFLCGWGKSPPTPSFSIEDPQKFVERSSRVSGEQNSRKRAKFANSKAMVQKKRKKTVTNRKSMALLQ